jgi:hypothetical protein
VAQHRPEAGNTGSIVLQNQEVVLGRISVYPEHDLVVLKNNTGITVLPAYKIESVHYYDSTANLNRRYISWVDPESSFAHHQLFEVVTMGKIPVVRRPMAWSNTSDTALNFNYFLLYEGAIIELQKFKRLVYPELITTSKEIETFVKRERLDPAQSGNAIRIIKHYNLHDHYEALALN